MIKKIKKKVSEELGRRESGMKQRVKLGPRMHLRRPCSICQKESESDLVLSFPVVSAAK